MEEEASMDHSIKVDIGFILTEIWQSISCLGNDQWHVFIFIIQVISIAKRTHDIDGGDRLPQPSNMPMTENGERYRINLLKRFGSHISYLSNDAIELYGAQYLQKFKALIIGGLQEYYAPAHLEEIQTYVLQGGKILLTAKEFAAGSLRTELGGEIASYFMYGDGRPDVLFFPSPLGMYFIFVRDLITFRNRYFSCYLDR
jgi:hypothetical protein